MHNFKNIYNKYVIKKGASVARFDKNGREFADTVCLHNDLTLGNDALLELERCEGCDAISAKFAVDSGYMIVDINDIEGHFIDAE